MFNEIEKQYCNDFCKQDDKSIKISFSLLMRLFEWCHEDAKDDVEMHKVMEKLVSFNDGVNPLKIDVYDCLISDLESTNMASNDDLDCAYNLGQECAMNDEELSSDGRDYSIVAGEIITDEKDNGYGASNDEIEQFWQGYENCMKPTTIDLDCGDSSAYAGCMNNCDLDDETEEEILKLIKLSQM